MEYHYLKNKRILCVFEKGRADKDVFFEVYKKLNKSKAKLVSKLQDVDYSPVVIYDLDGQSFTLIFDTMMDTFITGDYDILQKVQQIIAAE